MGRVDLTSVRGFDQVVGQSACIERLETFGRLYSGANAVPEHILLAGDDGNGKQMLLRAFAKTFNSGLRQRDADQIQKRFDLTEILASLEQGEAFFITNIHELREPILEILKIALKEFKIYLRIMRQGRIIRTQPLLLNEFTLLGTTPRIADVPVGLAECFALSLTVASYTDEELETIGAALSKRLGLVMGADAMSLVVKAGQRTPGSVDQLLRKFSRLGKQVVTVADANEILAAFGLVARTENMLVSTTNLDALSGVEFELIIKSLLQHMGFQAEMTVATGDGGIDIVANLDKPLVGGRYLIQCKRYGSPVGAATIREFYGAVVADRRATNDYDFEFHGSGTTVCRGSSAGADRPESA